VLKNSENESILLISLLESLCKNTYLHIPPYAPQNITFIKQSSKFFPLHSSVFNPGTKENMKVISHLV
jgi:hypothetical protein